MSSTAVHSPKKPDGTRGFNWPGGLSACGRGHALKQDSLPSVPSGLGRPPTLDMLSAEELRQTLERERQERASEQVEFSEMAVFMKTEMSRRDSEAQARIQQLEDELAKLRGELMHVHEQFRLYQQHQHQQLQQQTHQQQTQALLGALNIGGQQLRHGNQPQPHAGLDATQANIRAVHPMQASPNSHHPPPPITHAAAPPSPNIPSAAQGTGMAAPNWPPATYAADLEAAAAAAAAAVSSFTSTDARGRPSQPPSLGHEGVTQPHLYPSQSHVQGSHGGQLPHDAAAHFLALFKGRAGENGHMPAIPPGAKREHDVQRFADEDEDVIVVGRRK